MRIPVDCLRVLLVMLIAGTCVSQGCGDAQPRGSGGPTAEARTARPASPTTLDVLAAINLELDLGVEGKSLDRRLGVQAYGRDVATAWFFARPDVVVRRPGWVARLHRTADRVQDAGENVVEEDAVRCSEAEQGEPCLAQATWAETTTLMSDGFPEDYIEETISEIVTIRILLRVDE